MNCSINSVKHGSIMDNAELNIKIETPKIEPEDVINHSPSILDQCMKIYIASKPIITQICSKKLETLLKVVNMNLAYDDGKAEQYKFNILKPRVLQSGNRINIMIAMPSIKLYMEKNNTKINQFKIRNLNIGFLKLNNGELSTDITMQKLKANHLSTKCYFIKSKESNQNCLQIKYSKPLNGAEEVEVVIAQTMLNIELYAFLHIINIVLNGLPKNPEEEIVKKESKKRPFNAIVRCTECNIQIPSPEILADDLSLRGDLSFSMIGEMLTINMSKIMIYLHHKESFVTTRKILEDMSCNFTLANNKLEGAFESEVIINISYKDVIFLLVSAIYNINGIVQHYQGVEKKGKLKEHNYDISNIKQAIKKLNSRLARLSIKVGRSQKSKASEDDTTINIKFNKNFNLMLIQDFKGTFFPLLFITLSELTIGYISCGTQYSNRLNSYIDMLGYLQIENYNCYVSKWEPLIERVQFQISQQNDTDHKPQLNISVINDVIVTISDVFLSSLYDTINCIWPDDSIKRIHSNSSFSSPKTKRITSSSSIVNSCISSKFEKVMSDTVLFNLKNESGYHIEVRKQNATDESVYIIRKDEQASISAVYKECVAISRKRDAILFTILVYDENNAGTVKMTIRDVNLLSLDRRVIRGFYENSSESFIIESSINSNFKEVTIRSKLKFYNYTNEDFTIAIDGKPRSTLKSGSTYAFPFLHKQKIKLEDKNCNEGGNLDLDNSNDNYSKEYTYRIGPNAHKVKVKYRESDFIDVIIMPFYIIRNALPFDAYIQSMSDSILLRTHEQIIPSSYELPYFTLSICDYISPKIYFKEIKVGIVQSISLSKSGYKDAKISINLLAINKHYVGLYIILYAETVIIDTLKEKHFFIFSSKNKNSLLVPIFDDIILPSKGIQKLYVGVMNHSPTHFSQSFKINNDISFEKNMSIREDTQTFEFKFISKIEFPYQDQILFTRMIYLAPIYVIGSLLSDEVKLYQNDEVLYVLPAVKDGTFETRQPILNKKEPFKLVLSKENEYEIDLSKTSFDKVCLCNHQGNVNKLFTLSQRVNENITYLTLEKENIRASMYAIANYTDNFHIIIKHIRSIFSCPPLSKVAFGLDSILDQTLTLKFMPVYNGVPIIFQHFSKFTFTFDFDEINKGKKIKWPQTSKIEQFLYISVAFDGKTKVLQIEQIRGAIKKDTHDDVVLGDPEILNYTDIKIPAIGVSFVGKLKRKRQELVYFRIEGIELKRGIFKNNSEKYFFRVRNLQLDNNIEGCQQFPIILFTAATQRILLQQTTAEKERPFISLYLNKKQNELFIEKFHFLIQPFSIKMDSNIIQNIMALYSSLVNELHISKIINPIFLPSISSEVIDKSNIFKVSTSWCNRHISSSSSIMAIQTLKLSPLEIYFTYKDRPTSNKEGKTPNPTLAILKALLGNFEKAPFKLSALEASHITCQTDDLFSIIKSHYKSQISFNVLMAIGASDFIGNPINVASILSKSATDFFIKPAEADDPVMFAKSIAKGTFSMVQGATELTLGTASTITNTVSNGILSIAQDDQYNREREANKNKKKNVLTGIGFGLLGFGNSLLSAGIGIIKKPIEGGKAEGIGGVFKVIG